MTTMNSAVRTLKTFAIRSLLEAASLSGGLSVLPAAGGRGLIFTLHHVRPEPEGHECDPNAHLSVTPAFLEEAVQAALECRLCPVHLHDLPDLLADPSDERKFVSFTLDDGYRDNAEFAAPVFRRFDIPYTIFVNPGFVERTRTIWWETAAALVNEAPEFRFDFGDGPETIASNTTGQKLAAFNRLAALVESIDEDEAVNRIDDAARATRNIDPTAITDRLVMNRSELRDLSDDPLVHFGAHTVTHVNLRRVTSERLQEEIEESTDAIERYVGVRPGSFSYPYGSRKAAGGRELEAAAKAGFLATVTTQPGVLAPIVAGQAVAFPRVSLNGHFQKKRYVKALISGLPFLPVQARGASTQGSG
jgi:peptidoglycan/xylan/chitin deacetylase (PgdA/CDA1 family)